MNLWTPTLMWQIDTPTPNTFLWLPMIMSISHPQRVNIYLQVITTHKFFALHAPEGPEQTPYM